MRWLPAEARVGEPWRNGHGRTTRVATDGDDAGDADWRVSIAELHDGSPFSRFPGAARLLMPLSPTGVRLSINGRRRTCAWLQACAFDGEDAVHALDVTEPIEVLNLISQRHRRRGTLTAVSVDGTLELHASGLALLAIGISGRLVTTDGTGLDRLDGLWLGAGETAVVSGSGRLALVTIRDAESPATPRTR